MKTVKFTEDYRIAELPQFGGGIIDAKKGDVEEVSDKTAKTIVKVGKGEYCDDTEAKVVDSETENNGEETNTEGSEGNGFLGNMFGENPATNDKDNAEN